jgi:hypothetical protein
MGPYVLFLFIALLTFPSVHETPSQIWVEVHDSSPGYGTETLEDILTILGRHEVDRTIIFVIPNHGGGKPLSSYPEFVHYLQEKSAEGVEIGAHGYTHKGFEFRCSGEEGEARLLDSSREFRAVGLSPKVFAPPRYLVTRDSLDVLLDNYDAIFLFTKIVTPHEKVPSIAHDFTLGFPNWLALPLGKLSYYLNRGGIYRLVIHLDYTSNEESLEFLDEFLSWTDQKT